MARQSTPPPALNNLYKSDAMVPAYLTEIKYITPYLFVRNSERNSHIPRGVSVQLQTDISKLRSYFSRFFFAFPYFSQTYSLL